MGFPGDLHGGQGGEVPGGMGFVLVRHGKGGFTEQGLGPIRPSPSRPPFDTFEKMLKYLRTTKTATNLKCRHIVSGKISKR